MRNIKSNYVRPAATGRIRDAPPLPANPLPAGHGFFCTQLTRTNASIDGNNADKGQVHQLAASWS